jgi:hypothetical protein
MRIQTTKIFFENLKAINHDGKVYGKCINISNELVAITSLIIQLLQDDTTIKQDTINKVKIKKKAATEEKIISIQRMFQENITDYKNMRNDECDCSKPLRSDGNILMQRNTAPSCRC